MKKIQIFQLFIAAGALTLLILYFLEPGWDEGKILGIIAMVLTLAGALSSFIGVEKQKKKE